MTDAYHYYDYLHEAILKKPDYAAVYRDFATLTGELIGQCSIELNCHACGSFAVTDYILKYYAASAHMQKCMHRTRLRLSRFANSSSAHDMTDEFACFALKDYEVLNEMVALVSGEDIPMQARELFQHQEQESCNRDEHEEQHYAMRFLVEHIDEHYFYGRAEGHDTLLQVDYTHHWNSNEAFSWMYLKNYVTPGTQLNLIEPHLAGNTIQAELLIFEPDYLVNISDIGACFQPYADSFLNQLVHRLQPQAQSQAILLGAFASQLLDEEIYQNEQEHVYAESAKRFFKNNAFNMLSTPLDTDFHLSAQMQKQNIHTAVNELLKTVEHVDKSNLILEPSFFSPMLGLQGRIDMMQQDMNLIVEQKSGKCRFPYPKNNEAPTPLTAHEVQLLLYMMVMRYNYHEQYNKNGGVKGFLLYSKFNHSLSPMTWDRELMFQAIAVRNAIVWAEFNYARNGVHILDSLSASFFHQKQGIDVLWNRYCEPSITAVLAPIQQADELAKAYFHRMMRFISTEHLLSKLGTAGRDDHGMASIWLTSLQNKLQAGNIYTELHLIEPGTQHTGLVSDITLELPSHRTSLSNFRLGDAVIVYPYVATNAPNATHTLIFRASIAHLSEQYITLHLHAPQSDACVFTRHGDALWAVEHDFLESSFAPLYKGLHALLTTQKERRDLLLMRRPPRIDSTLQLNGDYGRFNDLCLQVKQAQDCFLIVGPPGTGKTSFGMLTTLKEQLTEHNSTVLITAYTNRAVDEICSKLCEEDIDFLRLSNESLVNEMYRPYCLGVIAEECATLSRLKQAVAQKRVVVATTTSLCKNLSLFKIKTFSLAIIDEASQILEPQIMPLLTVCKDGIPAIQKFVMIGDEKQLPAVVQQSQSDSVVEEEALKAIGLNDCRYSLFERMLKEYKRMEVNMSYMLTKQGRMHREIAAFPNAMFYENRLDTVPLAHQETSLNKTPVDTDVLSTIIARHRLAFIDVAEDEQQDEGSDKVNHAEAEVIAQLALRIYLTERPHFSSMHTLGVIVPYRAQIMTVKNHMAALGIEALNNITIDTVECYQGSQRDYIIFGFTIKKYYQLNFIAGSCYTDEDKTIDRKLNVGMTRAREQLFMVGNSSILHENAIYDNLMKYIDERQAFYSLHSSQNATADAAATLSEST